MSERYPNYLCGGAPVSSWERNFGSIENQIQQQYRSRWWGGGQPAGRCWGSMSEGGGVSAVGDNSRTNLIVNYLPQTMTEKDLYAMFMSIGPIESCRVMKDFKTGYSYGFGFVNFTTEEDATRAIETFNGYSLRNKRLKVSYARPSGEEIKDTNLYVTNLPRAITEQQLETIFGKYGRIVQKHILRDKASGTPRGVAFVRYDKREEAQEAISALNNVIPEGGTEPLSVKIAEEHGKQKAAYYAGWSAGFQQNRGDFFGPMDCGDFGAMPIMPEPPCFPPIPPLGGPSSHPNTPRGNGYAGRPPLGGPNTRGYPNHLPGKGPRPMRGRNLPWSGGYGPGEERFKGQRFRNVPPTYW